MREQERRKREAMRRADGIKNELGGKMRNAELLAGEAKRRAEQVKRRIEVGDVDPRPLPGLREDSLPSMGSMESSESMPSMQSTESAELTSGVPSEEEAYAGGGMGEDMPLGIDPRGAHEELGQRITEDTGAEGDIHLHAARRGEAMKKEMTEDTGADGDMMEHADRKVQQMENELLGD
jgi:hypothetical protein